jgi:hypothetical protein
MSTNSHNTADQNTNQEQQERQEAQKNNRRLRQAARQLSKIIIHGVNVVGSLIRIFEFFGGF